MTREQIDLEVMRRYPKNPDELRGCQMTIVMRNQMRKEYRTRLEDMGEEGIRKGVIN
jgi:hypothetical protein